MSLSGSGYSERPHQATSIIVDELSYTTALIADETWTSGWIDVEGYDSIIIAVSTDQNGSYSVAFSPDGVNIDSTLTRYFRTNKINPPHRFTITRKYARVSYTNGSDGAQTYFRFQTSLGTYQPLNAPLDGTLSPDFDAIVVRSTDYHYEVAEGLRQGHRTFNKFGYNDAVRTSYETIWPIGGIYTPPADGEAETLNIVSSSGNDAGDVSFQPTSTGAAAVQIIGLDANRKTQTVVYALDGISTVTTTETWLGINRMVTLYHGSNQANVGNITATLTTDGRTMAYIPAGEGVTQQVFYHTQYQANALADWLWLNFNRASGGGNPVIDVRIRTYSPITNAFYLVFKCKIDTTTDTIIQLNPEQPFQFSPGDVALLEAVSSANADTVVNARLSLIEIEQAAYDPNS